MSLDGNIMDKVSGLYQNPNLETALASIHEQKHRDRNPVIEIQKSIENHVRNFESKLDSDEEIMVMVASFGSSVTFYVYSIEFNQPNLITFHGRSEEDTDIRLIQHCNQLNFLLKSVKKLNRDEKRTQIGFIHSS